MREALRRLPALALPRSGSVGRWRSGHPLSLAFPKLPLRSVNLLSCLEIRVTRLAIHCQISVHRPLVCYIVYLPSLGCISRLRDRELRNGEESSWKSDLAINEGKALMDEISRVHLERLRLIEQEIIERFGWQQKETRQNECYATDARGEVLCLKTRGDVASSSTYTAWIWPPSLEYDALIGISVSHDYELQLVMRISRRTILRSDRPKSDRIYWNDTTWLNPDVAI